MTDHFRGYTLIHQQIVWCNASLSIVISPLAVCDSSEWDLETPTMLWNYPQIVIQLRPNHLKKLGDHALPWFPHHLANKTVPKRKIERGLNMGTNKSSICYTILCITRLNKFSKFEVEIVPTWSSPRNLRTFNFCCRHRRKKRVGSLESWEPKP